MVEGSVAWGTKYEPLPNVRRHKQGGNTHAISVEIKGVRRPQGWGDSSRRGNVVETAAVLIEHYNEQARRPKGALAQGVVDSSNETLARRDACWWMLIILGTEEREVIRFDERVGWKSGFLSVRLELRKAREVMPNPPQSRQGGGLS